MSTPIETNTEELQEILQTVYNLPMAGGGSSEPDLVITPITDSFNVWGEPGDSTYANRVTFDPAKVIATCDKVLAGKEVNVAFTGSYILTTSDPYYATTYTATGVAANILDKGSAGIWKRLVVQFSVMCYTYYSIPTENRRLEFIFGIDTSNQTVTLDKAFIVDQQ